MEASMDSFEALFSELAVIKAKADNLPLEERRAYAEKIALSFYAAMGGGDSEDEEDWSSIFFLFNAKPHSCREWTMDCKW